MFLICTADERFWPNDGAVLFLGEWCRRESRRDRWEKLEGAVLPYHWDDRGRFHRDYEQMRRLAERCLEALVPQLNRLHRMEMPAIFWDLVLGNWLIDFIGGCYDRFQSIAEAAATGRVTGTVIPGEDHARFCAPTIRDSFQWYLTSAYNHHLYGCAIRHLKSFPFREVQNDWAPPETTPQPDRRAWVKRLWRSLYRHAPATAKRIVLADTFFSTPDLLRLCLALRQLPAPPCEDRIAPRYDAAIRQRLSVNFPGGAFEKFLSEMLPCHLPGSVVEGFAELEKRSKESYPARATVILTANAHVADDVFKLWAARSRAAGARLQVQQHGGNYGSVRMSATEDYEVRVADVFLSWGWAVPGKGKIQPLPAAKLITATRRLRPKIDGGILVCGDAVPGLFYRFASMPVAHQIRRSNADIVQFFRTLAPPAAAISWLRLYPIDYGWEEKAYFENALPDIAIFQGAGGFVEQINSSRLFVGTSNQTTYLETMSAGFPTIVFWNPSYNEIRREAQPAFDALENAGIFHRTPESAAQHVNKVAADPRDWWNRPQTLAARQEFCARFARTSRGWISEWTQALQSAVNNRPECS